MVNNLPSPGNLDLSFYKINQLNHQQALLNAFLEFRKDSYMEAGFYCTGSQFCPHRNTEGLGNALNYDETTAKND